VLTELGLSRSVAVPTLSTNQSSRFGSCDARTVLNSVSVSSPSSYKINYIFGIETLITESACPQPSTDLAMQSLVFSHLVVPPSLRQSPSFATGLIPSTGPS
jgi:hypothetical protein